LSNIRCGGPVRFSELSRIISGPKVNRALRGVGFSLRVFSTIKQNPQAEQIEEKLTSCHSEGRGLAEESAFSWNWRRKADPSLRSG